MAGMLVAAGCGTSSSSDPLVESVGYFRSLGFFKSQSDLSDSELLDRIQRTHEAKWGEPIEGGEPHADLALLRADRERVWWNDLEADALEGNRVYIDTLSAWGRISRGWFRPRGIREKWGGTEGPVEIAFQQDGKPLTLRPAWIDAWIDLQLVCEINRTLTGRPGLLSVYSTFDQTAFVVALTPQERAQLERERGWQFEDTCREGWLGNFVEVYGP
jgi:hypothetical protein